MGPACNPLAGVIAKAAIEEHALMVEHAPDHGLRKSSFALDEQVHADFQAGRRHDDFFCDSAQLWHS